MSAVAAVVVITGSRWLTVAVGLKVVFRGGGDTAIVVGIRRNAGFRAGAVLLAAAAKCGEAHKSKFLRVPKRQQPKLSVTTNTATISALPNSENSRASLTFRS